MTPRLGLPRRILPVALALLAVAHVAPAADPPTVEKIVANYVKARGGLKKIQSIKTLRESGQATSGPNRQALVTRLLKRPGFARFEYTMQGITGVLVSDGQRAWRMSPFEGDTEPIPLAEEAVQESVEQGDIEGPLVDWKNKGHRVELVGRETVDGQDTYKLKLRLKSGGERYEYIDARSFQRVRSDSTRTIRGLPVQVMTTFSDYKKTSGLLFPGKVEIQAAGRPQSLRIVVNRVEVNPDLSDALFQMPAKAQPATQPSGSKPAVTEPPGTTP